MPVLEFPCRISVVGAVISEWLGGFSGLGVYMTRVKKAFAYDKMFAVIFLISHYQPASYEAGGNSAEKGHALGKCEIRQRRKDT